MPEEQRLSLAELDAGPLPCNGVPDATLAVVLTLPDHRVGLGVGLVGGWNVRRRAQESVAEHGGVGT
jgi:hypothetical protein